MQTPPEQLVSFMVYRLMFLSFVFNSFCVLWPIVIFPGSLYFQLLIALSVFSNVYFHSCFVDLYLKHYFNVLPYLALSSCFVGSFFSISWISGLLPPTPGDPLYKINEKTWRHSINLLNYLYSLTLTCLTHLVLKMSTISPFYTWY